MKLPQLGMTIPELQQAMASGELSAVGLTSFFLNRILQLDRSGPTLNSIVTVNPEAVETARRLDEERAERGPRSLLHGIPLVIKDNFDTGDMPTTASSRQLAEHRPDSDSELVRRLRQAGAIILAKTNLSEFACHGWTDGSLIGQTKNPYDLTRTPGGSSGGTAVAVAAHLAVAGLGTDTANSVRSPASATNLAGLRPTTGLLSSDGIIPVSKTQDSAGPLARSVTDIAVLMDVLTDQPAGSYQAALNSDGLSGKRLGLLNYNLGDDETVRPLMEQAIRQMQDAGVTIIPLDIPELEADRVSRECDVQIYEFADQFNAYLARQSRPPVRDFKALVESDQLYPPIRSFMERCAVTKPGDEADYQQKLANIARNKQLILAAMEQHQLDALVYPHQKILVELIGRHSQAGRNGIVASTLGFPALTVPAGFSEASPTAPIGLPVGIEFMARPGQEALLLEIGYAFEQLTRHHKSPHLDE